MRYFECNFNNKKIFNPYDSNKKTLFENFDDARKCSLYFMEKYFNHSKIIKNNWNGFFTKIEGNNSIEIKRINIYSDIDPVKNKIVLSIHENDIRKLQEISKNIFIKNINEDEVIYYDDSYYDLFEKTSIKFDIKRNLNYGYYLNFDLNV